MEELRKDIAELKQYEAAAVRPKVKDILMIQVRKLESDLILLEEKEMASGAPDNDCIEKPTKPLSKSETSYKVVLKTYAWDQSDKYLKIYVSDNMSGVQNISADKISCTFTPSSMRFTVRDFNKKTFELYISNLYSDISTTQSSYKVKKDMVLLMLHKADIGKHWSHVTKVEAKVDNKKKSKKMEPPAAAGGAGEDPSSNLMGLLKQMYDDGDDEMKRTLAKAWSESQDKKMAGMDV